MTNGNGGGNGGGNAGNGGGNGNGELKGRLDRLASRGTARGPDDVLYAARAAARAVPGRPSRSLVVGAAALVIAIVGGVATAGWLYGDPRLSDLVAQPVPVNGAGATATTVEPPVEEVQLPIEFINASRLVPFAGCRELTDYTRAKAVEAMTPWGLPISGDGGVGPMPVFAEGRAAAGGAAPPTAAEDGQPVPGQALAVTDPGPSFSTTNVQEAGIDEPDVVKTDGRRIFAVAQGRVWAVAADAPRVLGSLPVEGAGQLLLAGDRLVVVTGGGTGHRQLAPDSPVWVQSSRIVILDVSNPAAMRVTHSMEVDGWHVSSRLIGGVARLVVRSTPRIPYVYPTEGSEADNAAALARNRDLARAAPAEAWLPTFRLTDGAGRLVEEGTLSTCASSYRPPEFSGFGMLTVLTLDPRNPASSAAESVMADGDTVYASGTRMYVASNQWGRFDPAAGMVAPSAESLIHAFDISDPAGAEYLVSGKVRGTVLNQFSMSEYEGRLRVATTDPADGSQSFVTVLANQGGALVEVGQVGGLGRGERIYAVRFIGPTGYVVTFRQVDPLYVVDLRDPTRPRVTGELKIAGYSAYLHPIGDGLLLGVGVDATEEGQRIGSQVSVFDVSNPAAPRRLHQHMLGSGGSPAEFDHHAFLYWPATRLAVVPYHQWSMDDGSQQFAGAVGMRVGADGIVERGRAQHPPMPEGYRPDVQRSLVISNNLFTLSDRGILASDLATLADRQWVPFA